ncbi:MAG: hypothetical protein RIS79_3992 [Verrucomicrobiota bacterium]|jgi:hypothetical protein
MPYDPTLPAPNSPLESQVIRDQLQSLFVLINNIASIAAAQVDSTNTLPPSSPANASVTVSGNTLHFSFEIPQGQEGPMGQQGPPFSQAVVDAVNTVDPGTPAAVGVSFDGTNVRFTFDIPRGNDGMNGSNGSDGSQGPPGNDGGQGPPGNDGAQGPPFAQAIVDSVTTLDPGNPATVGVSFDGSNVRFTFGIPRGNDGSNGSDGSQGPPGEISQAQLDSAISGTSANTNGVGTLDTGFADPDMEAMRQKVNEMILNGRR